MEFTEGRTDADLTSDVLDELNSEPSTNSAEIGVLVKDGVVTLNGQAENHGEKLNAVRVAMQVAGVLAVADDIKVALPEWEGWKDSDIATAAANRIAWCTMMPVGAVEVSVSNGRITLGGVLERSYQIQAAENAIQNLAGVTGINNLIKIGSTSTAPENGSYVETGSQGDATMEGAESREESSGDSSPSDDQGNPQAEPEDPRPEFWSPPGDQPVETQLKMDWFWGTAN